MSSSSSGEQYGSLYEAKTTDKKIKFFSNRIHRFPSSATNYIEILFEKKNSYDKAAAISYPYPIENRGEVYV